MGRRGAFQIRQLSAADDATASQDFSTYFIVGPPRKVKIGRKRWPQRYAVSYVSAL